LSSNAIIGRDIRVFEETTSTNDVIREVRQDGVAEGVVVFAESQTKGRAPWQKNGRRPGQGSVVLGPAPARSAPPEATRLTVASATALRRAIQSHTGLKCEIKWPNDILLAGKKVAGILTELHAELDHVKSLILGIGVDVNLSPSDFPAEVRNTATSLKIECGRHVPRAELSANFIRAGRRLPAHFTGSFMEVADEWSQFCTTLGRSVTIRVGDRVVRGRAESLDDSGALLLRTEHGTSEPIIGGDLTLEK
jgi:BirA family biotin operon repressor/biotin-[acetyl-CoA-carboxylase] ligase